MTSQTFHTEVRREVNMPVVRIGRPVDPIVVCPRCRSAKQTRIVPTDRGYDQKLLHVCCDGCTIGWFQYPGSMKTLNGGLEQARKVYVPKGEIHGHNK